MLPENASTKEIAAVKPPNQINEKSKIAYFCGDNVAYDLDLELKREGLKISKIIINPNDL